MNIVIDIGNSFKKVSVFHKNDEVFNSVKENLDTDFLSDVLKKYRIAAGILSSVSGDVKNIVNYLQKKLTRFVVLTHTTRLPYINNYQTKETLGKDRLAGIAGAFALYPDENVLVIDAGTAITYDVITKSGEYIGGNISEGLEMRFKALHQFTHQLPQLKPVEDWDKLGNSTDSAIIAGVQNGILMEVEGTIDLLKSKLYPLKVIITGGNARFFDNKLKNTIFVVPNLISIGLNSILNYNVKNS
jgi:type III pantothenate kinase